MTTFSHITLGDEGTAVFKFVTDGENVAGELLGAQIDRPSLAERLRTAGFDVSDNFAVTPKFTASMPILDFVLLVAITVVELTEGDCQFDGPSFWYKTKAGQLKIEGPTLWYDGRLGSYRLIARPTFTVFVAKGMEELEAYADRLERDETLAAAGLGIHVGSRSGLTFRLQSTKDLLSLLQQVADLSGE